MAENANINSNASNAKTTHVMVVDDSAVIRSLFTGVLNNDSSIQVLASANNGQTAIDTLKRFGRQIDVITLDIQMPGKDGLEALPELLRIHPNVKVIMASTLSTSGAKETLEALNKGASDFLGKPDTSDREAMHQFAHELVEKVKALSNKGQAQHKKEPQKNVVVNIKPEIKQPESSISLRQETNTKPEILAIGSSTGGPQALSSFFAKIKGKKLNAPILITQHMPADFTTLLAKQLSKISGLDVAEAKDGEEIDNSKVYLAPGGYHMLVEKQGTHFILRTTQDAPENFCRPAVDPMLRSISNAYHNKVLVMILTGMGTDGAKGSKEVVDAGGTIIAQDEKTSVVWGMPGAVANQGLCSHVLSLEDLSDKFIELAKGQIR